VADDKIASYLYRLSGPGLFELAQSMAMHGYYFAARVTSGQVRPTPAGSGRTVMRPQIWTGWQTCVVYASDQSAAQKLYEDGLHNRSGDGDIKLLKVEQIVSFPFLDQMLTETGNLPVEWQKLNQQFEDDMRARSSNEKADVQADNFEQGNWLDPATDIPLVSNMDLLRQQLPPDISTGLNWSADKQFFFLIAILALPPVPVFDPETGLPVEKVEPEISEVQTPAEDADEIETCLLETGMDDPTMVDKVAAVVVRARNAAAAIWLWRKYSARGKLVQNPIRLDPWVGVYGAEDAPRS
jgi:hypothetical protein